MHLLAMYMGGLCTVVAQLLWKAQSKKTKVSNVGEYFKLFSILGYVLFFASIFLTTYGLREIRLIELIVITPLIQILVIVFSWVIFKEKLTKHQLISIAIVVLGIIIFGLDF